MIESQKHYLTKHLAATNELDRILARVGFQEKFIGVPEAQLKRARLAPKSRTDSLLKSRDGGKRKTGDGALLGGTVVRFEQEERSRAAKQAT